MVLSTPMLTQSPEQGSYKKIVLLQDDLHLQMDQIKMLGLLL